MKIPVGIVGYGNLGKAVETKIKESKMFKLEAIFSRRKLPFSKPIEDIKKYKNKIKLLFLCVGSQNDLENIAKTLIKDFNTIDSYDNHNRLKKHIEKIDRLAKQNKKIALCSIGWDPGLFSMMRSLYNGLGLKPYTFWGKGLSQGHTQAIKNIDGVTDAIQFTIPDEKAIEQIKQGKGIDCDKKLHKRLCYVVAKEKQKDIEKKIKTMKDYFLGYETKVNFVSQEELNSLKSFSHQGEVICKNDIINFKLNIPSNPDFTASILVAFARCSIALQKEKCWGAYTILDLPVKYLLEQNKYNFL